MPTIAAMAFVNTFKAVVVGQSAVTIAEKVYKVVMWAVSLVVRGPTSLASLNNVHVLLSV